MRKESWLDPVRESLDQRRVFVDLFVRDDDAGWENDRLFVLLDVVQSRGVPIDVAAIPAALTSSSAADLRRRLDSSDGLVSVHQHGLAHANHEPDGRKSEFGPSRSLREQREDIATGRCLLEDRLGTKGNGVFTPPWNRCTGETVAALVDLGFNVLSRDRTAPALGGAGLHELTVGLDWTGRRGCALGAVAWGQSIARVVAEASAPVGLMLHHAVMMAADHQLLGELLELLGAHPAVRVRPMLQWRGDA
jgi:hypothetical protein